MTDANMGRKTHIQTRNLTDTERTELRKQFALETTYRIDETILDSILKAGKVESLKCYEPVIETGEYDPDVYVVKEGLIRGTYLDGNIEKTAGFALPGSLLISFQSFYAGQPSYIQFEACCGSEVLNIPKEVFMQFIKKHHEFAIWVMSAHQNQLYYNEYKSALLNGDAKSRFLQLTQRLSGLLGGVSKRETGDRKVNGSGPSHDERVKSAVDNRWNDIFKVVPSKIIASYLGITEQSLSRIKKELLHQGIS